MRANAPAFATKADISEPATELQEFEPFEEYDWDLKVRPRERIVPFGPVARRHASGDFASGLLQLRDGRVLTWGSTWGSERLFALSKSQDRPHYELVAKSQSPFLVPTGTHARRYFLELRDGRIVEHLVSEGFPFLFYIYKDAETIVANDRYNLPTESIKDQMAFNDSPYASLLSGRKPPLAELAEHRLGLGPRCSWEQLPSGDFVSWSADKVVYWSKILTEPRTIFTGAVHDVWVTLDEQVIVVQPGIYFHIISPAEGTSQTIGWFNIFNQSSIPHGVTCDGQVYVRSDRPGRQKTLRLHLKRGDTILQHSPFHYLVRLHPEQAP